VAGARLQHLERAADRRLLADVLEEDDVVGATWETPSSKRS